MVASRRQGRGIYSSRCHFSTSMIQLVLAHITHKIESALDSMQLVLNFRANGKAGVTQPDYLRSFQIGEGVISGFVDSGNT